MDPKLARLRAEGGAAGTERVRGAIYCMFAITVSCLKIVLICSCFFSNRYLDVIEQALACGETVLIENLQEKVDPVLEPLLGRNTIKRGRLVMKLRYYIYIVVLGEIKGMKHQTSFFFWFCKSYLARGCCTSEAFKINVQFLYPC